MPHDVVLGGEAVHAEGHENVSDSSLLGSGELARTDTDDFEGPFADVERAAEHSRIAAEALREGGRFRQSVAPLYARQTIDIEYE